MYTLRQSFKDDLLVSEVHVDLFYLDRATTSFRRMVDGNHVRDGKRSFTVYTGPTPRALQVLKYKRVLRRMLDSVWEPFQRTFDFQKMMINDKYALPTVRRFHLCQVVLEALNAITDIAEQQFD